MSQSALIKLRSDRINDLEAFEKAGINPFPSSSSGYSRVSELIDDFDKHEGERRRVVGRIMGYRDQGKVIFIDLQDGSSKIQGFLKSDAIGDTNTEAQTLGFDLCKRLSVGDFLEITGRFGKTKREEVTIFADAVRILSKALRPLPDKWDGVQNIETKLRGFTG